MEQITILGATGMVGEKILQKAIHKQNRVKILARSKEKIQDFSTDIEIVEGNYFDTTKLEIALSGSNVILSTIGPSFNTQLSSADEKKYINSLKFIIQQMHKNNQQRWIGISCAGVKMENENLPLARKLLRVKLMTASKSIINIKERELELLQQSNLNWTSVRSPKIKEEVKGDFTTDENKFIGNTVDANQLSDFILDEITSNKWIQKAPVVGTK